MVKTQVPGSCSLEPVFVTLCNGSCFRTNSQDHNFLTIKKKYNQIYHLALKV